MNVQTVATMKVTPATAGPAFIRGQWNGQVGLLCGGDRGRFNCPNGRKESRELKSSQIKSMKRMGNSKGHLANRRFCPNDTKTTRNLSPLKTIG